MDQGVEIEDGCIVNVNPATGEEISRVPCTPLSDLDAVIQRARDSFPLWSSEATLDERIQFLRQGLDVLETQEETLVASIVQEMGKPISEAQDEVKLLLSKRGEYLDLLQAALEPQRQRDSGDTVVVREALGVVVVLSPWNFPADEILSWALPALGSGNVVLVKPSEVTPETGALVVSSLAQALPPGVLQLVQGDSTVSDALVAHPHVDFVAMMGSAAAEQRESQSEDTSTTTITAAASAAASPSTTHRKTEPPTSPTSSSASLAPSPLPLKRVPSPMKRMALEMGGKDPMIVFDDADLDLAARHAVAYSLANTGQASCSLERIYIADKVYDDFAKRVVDEAATYRVGNGQDPDVKVGPLASTVQRDNVAAQVDDALEKGAKLLYQSDVPSGGENDDDSSKSTDTSCFYPVTVLGDVTHDMEVFRRETFGPVVALSRFDGTEDQAIELANQTEFGLCSNLYTCDLEKAQRVAKFIVAGQIGVNCYAMEHLNVHTPWCVRESND